MKVEELMSKNIICARENSSVLQIASQMRRENIGSLPVCDDKGVLKGIVTDRDIVLRFVAGYASARGERQKSDIPVSAIMTTAPATISPSASVHEAALIFSAKQIRRLPVVENSKLVGMLTLGDIAKKQVYIDEAGDALSAISCT